jgi:N-acetylhexosamine 1-kinase
MAGGRSGGVTMPLEIAACFAVSGVPVTCVAHTAGHINQTWFVATDDGSRYVLQRINRHVFADPPAIAANTARLIACVDRTAPGLVPPFVAARDGAPSVQAAGETYRLLGWVAGRSLTALESAAQAAAAGAAFGTFQRALIGYDAAGHSVPIEGFQSLEKQLERFAALLGGPANARIARAREDIALAERQRDALADAPLGPSGMIHGDTKVSNLIYAADTDEVVAVVDLDTVMWGRRSWDFGDLVRSAAALGGEDDPAVEFSVDRFHALAAGFVRGAGELVDQELRAALVTAPAYMTYMLALRFLIDHLDGDRYFRVAHPEHNLERARSQLRLLASMQRARGQLERILEKL